MVAWDEEYRSTRRARCRGELDVEEIDQLATAAYMTGREHESFEVWGRGHQRCLETGDVGRATRFGVRLAQALGFTGDFARVSGWVERSNGCWTRPTSTVLNAGSRTRRGMCRIFADGDIAAARAAFVRAAKIGERFRDTELLTSRPHRGGPVHDLPRRDRGGPVAA